VLAAAILAPAAAQAVDNGLARTPYMGWNTYYGLGIQYNESDIKSAADAMVSTGLAAAGYRYVWLDGGWWSGARDSNGNISVDSRQWPDGMRAVADYIHDRGLLAGIYTDAGATGCGGAPKGSYGHYQQDVDQFADWGFDAVKVDFCGGNRMHLRPEKAYAAFRAAIDGNSSRRPILFNICNPFQSDQYGHNRPAYHQSAYATYLFASRIANSWRTDTDLGRPFQVTFNTVLRNLARDDAHPEAAGPGHWNDPDYLAPGLGMSDREARAQFTMWAVVAAPLMLGNDVRHMSAGTRSTVTNQAAIVIDQDPLGVQGHRIATSRRGDVWVKPLADGGRAVALLNRGPRTLRISTTARAIGLPAARRYTAQNVWSGWTGTTRWSIGATVRRHEAVLYRVSRSG